MLASLPKGIVVQLRHLCDDGPCVHDECYAWTIIRIDDGHRLGGHVDTEALALEALQRAARLFKE